MSKLMILMSIIVTIATIINTEETNTKTCFSLFINEQWHNAHPLWTRGRPYNMNLHRPTNTLFFSFDSTETSSETDFQLATLNINDRDFQHISDVPGGFSIAINKDTGEVFLGGHDGIYKYNFHKNAAEPYMLRGKNIWGLFHHKNLFYIGFPNQQLHMEVDGEFVKVKEFQYMDIDLFYISSSNDVYIANRTGFYKYLNMSSKVEIISKLLVVRQMVEDVNNNVYACTDAGVFIDRGNGFKKIADFKDVYGLEFDENNNMIISDQRSIMRVVEAYRSPC